MVFAAFAVWVLLILLMGMAIYRLWGNLLGPRRADWVLLPGSVVSELAYSIGLLLTGRPAAGGLIRHNGNSAAPGQRPTGKYRFAISMLAAFTSLVAGFVVLAVTTKAIGKPMVESLVAGDVLQSDRPKELPETWAELKDQLRPFWILPRELPDDGDAFKDDLHFQWRLLGRLGSAVVKQDWLTWQMPLFAYLSICFAIRLGAVRHDWRASLITAAALVSLVALAGAAWDGMEDIIDSLKLWSLLTYTWVVLLAILAGTILATGVMALIRALRGNPKSSLF